MSNTCKHDIVVSILINNFRNDNKINDQFCILLSDDNFLSNKSAHPLDLIFDLKSLNRLLQKQHLPKLEQYETFLRTARRELIVAHYISPKETHELSVMKGEVKSRVEKGFQQDSVIDCSNHLSNYRAMIENALNGELKTSQSLALTQEQFRVDKYWCINMTVFSTPQETAERLGLGGERDNVSLIVVNWRGMGKRQVVRNSAKGVHLNNRIAMMKGCKQHLSTGWRHLISYSPLVLQTARHFASFLGLSPTDAYAAVHIRSEKLGLREARLPGVTEACFNELMKLKNRLVQDKPSLKVFYIADFAPYSSDTCKNCRGAKDVKKLFLQRNIYNTYFDPLHFNVTLDNGLAAAVESQFLASANFLFLCGGGGYQTQITARFLDVKHKTNTDYKHKDVFKVCNDDTDVSRLLKLGTTAGS